MRRREFLKTAGSFLATASVHGLLGCSDDAPSTEPDTSVFPHGVASGDPRADSVILWTRVQPSDTGAAGATALRLEVATDDSFHDLVVERRELMAGPDSDFTLRVLVEELAPDTVYYYRFSTDSATSRVGRTWTAPAEDADVPIRLAWISCQDYSSGFYGGYRRLIEDDEQSDPQDRLRFVLHVGDFIYETRGEDFQSSLNEDLDAVPLIDRTGAPRSVPPFPSEAGDDADARAFAQTVDDYRHLYKTFLSDPDLQAARARWPFVCVWDDHEFSNDCWQTQANYTRESTSDEPSQRRKLAANQAWFEYIPALLAHDFQPADVDDVAYTEPVEVDEVNNQRALASLTIYRNFRFGQHVELVLTDNRSYRSDHALAEESTLGNPLIVDPRAVVPIEAVNILDAGRTANGGDPPDEVAGFPNTRKDSPPGTILGPAQKQWWKDAMRNSSASFKVWANSLPLLRIRLDTTAVPIFPDDLLLSADGWDGYPSERRELMTFLRDEQIANVVSLSGDHHAHFAGVVMDDYDSETPTPVMVDFAGAGLTSLPEWASVASQIDTAAADLPRALVDPVIDVIVYDSTEFGGSQSAVVNLNTLIRYGSTAATVAAASHDLSMIEAARDPTVNPHLRYADTGANGYGIAVFDGAGARVELLSTGRPLEDLGPEGIAIRGRASFTLALTKAGEAPVLDEPELTGDKPFPLA
jgi:alkaline phosphatase D